MVKEFVIEVLIIWAILMAFCMIPLGLWELARRAIKKFRGRKKSKRPKSGESGDDDNSWLNNQHFDPH